MSTERRRMFSRMFICQGCGKFPDAPILKDELWRSLELQFLCIACLERHLGREITVSDLKPCSANAATILLVERAHAAARPIEPANPIPI